jgi:hypothetical protein
MRKKQIYLLVIALAGLIVLVLDRTETIAEIEGNKNTVTNIQELRIEINISDIFKNIPFNANELELDSEKPISSYTSFTRILQNEIDEILKMKEYFPLKPVAWKKDPERNLEINIDGLQLNEKNEYIYSIQVSLKEKVILLSADNKWPNGYNANIWWEKSKLTITSEDELYQKVLAEVKYMINCLVVDFASHLAKKNTN